MPAVLTPRPLPERRLPMMAGAGTVVFALPLFLLAQWPIRGWGLGALLWVGSQVLELLFARIGIAGTPSVRGSGAVAFGMMGRGILVMAVAFAVAVTNPAVGVAGILLYAAAYTVELAAFLANFFVGDTRR